MATSDYYTQIACHSVADVTLYPVSHPKHCFPLVCKLSKPLKQIEPYWVAWLGRECIAKHLCTTLGIICAGS